MTPSCWNRNFTRNRSAAFWDKARHVASGNADSAALRIFSDIALRLRSATIPGLEKREPSATKSQALET